MARPRPAAFPRWSSGRGRRESLSSQNRCWTSFADAARAAGFTPADTALGDRTEAALSELASPDVAKAAFAAPQGGTTSPIKSALGWHLVHVDAIKSTAAQPLAKVRDKIAASLAKQKADEAIVNLIAEIEDQISDGSTFDDVVKARGLTVVTTPAILPSGDAPENAEWKAPSQLQSC